MTNHSDINTIKNKMKAKTANITTGQIFVPRQFSVISGGQNGRKSANIEVKSQKSAKMNEILNA